MRTAKISELKNQLSRYLRYVRRGESVLVLDRDRPVARIEPIRTPPSSDLPMESERAGVLRGPEASLPPNWLEGRVDARADVVAALLEERASGR
jgi:prevent-host-death family protein